jgi:hypothetical protein
LIKHGRAADKGFPFGEKKMHRSRIQHRSMCVVLFQALSRGEGVDDFFKQRSSERAQRKENLV